jgi:N-carbamoyl-L-amino-acid hydrolase
MNPSMPSAYINGDRLWARHEDFSRFGVSPGGGVNRQALSQEELAARGQMLDWASERGFSTSIDDIANLFIRLEGTEPDAPPVLTGSHIDSQPTGGRFDGTFGVLAGLEVIEAVVASGLRSRRSIEVVAWTNEEGSRFAPGMMGSEAFAGLRPMSEILAVTDHHGTTVADALSAVKRAHPMLARRDLGGAVHCFVEAHIEQGPVLERERLTIGAVTGIQGVRRFRVRLVGEAAHAGTTPRAKRRDALLAANRIIAALAKLTAEPEDVMFTVGMLQLEPNAPSVVPREAYFSIDLRHPDNRVLNRLANAVAPLCERESGACELELKEIARADSLSFPEAMVARVESAAHNLGLGAMRMPSLAGHDARQLHQVCQTGMIFVPCKDGVSHSERESAKPEDLAAGARVLADVVWGLAND